MIQNRWTWCSYSTEVGKRVLWYLCCKKDWPHSPNSLDSWQFDFNELSQGASSCCPNSWHQQPQQRQSTSQHENLLHCIPPRMLPVPGSAAGQWPSVLRAWAGWKSDQCEKATRPTNRPCWACQGSPWHPNDPPAPQWCNLCSPAARLPCWRSPCRASDMPWPQWQSFGSRGAQRLGEVACCQRCQPCPWKRACSWWSPPSQVNLNFRYEMAARYVTTWNQIHIYDPRPLAKNPSAYQWSKRPTGQRFNFQILEVKLECRTTANQQRLQCKLSMQSVHCSNGALGHAAPVDGLGMWTGRRVPALNLNSGCAQLEQLQPAAYDDSDLSDLKNVGKRFRHWDVWNARLNHWFQWRV